MPCQCEACIDGGACAPLPHREEPLRFYVTIAGAKRAFAKVDSDLARQRAALHIAGDKRAFTKVDSGLARQRAALHKKEEGK